MDSPTKRPLDHYLVDDNVTNRLVEEWRKYGKIIIAYDFDDTVFDFHNKGRRYDNVIELLQTCERVGAYFIVFTSCNEGQYPDIEKYLKEKNIPYNKINENMEFIPFTGRKIYYNILLDDRAGLKSAFTSLIKAARIIMEERLSNVKKMLD